MSGIEALAICEKAECDIVLLDVMMPDMDGFEVCRRLKANPSTHHIPVVMVTALDHPSDRVRGLEAGADDFLTKPVSDVALIARVRSLARLKMMTDELRMRAFTSREIGIQSRGRRGHGRHRPSWPRPDRRRPRRFRTGDCRDMLSDEHTVDVEPNPSDALFHAAEGNYDLIIISLALRTLTRCGCAARCARSSAPATCRSWRSADGEDNARHDPRAGDRRERLSAASDRQE